MDMYIRLNFVRLNISQEFKNYRNLTLPSTEKKCNSCSSVLMEKI